MTPSERRSTWILTGLWLAIFATLWFFRQVLLPFGAALLVAYILAPLVDRLSSLRIGKRPIPRGVSIISIYVGIGLLVYGFVVAAAPQLYHEAVRLTQEARQLASTLTPQKVAELTQAAEDWFARQGLPVSLGEDADPSALASEADDGGAKLHLDLHAAVKSAAVDLSRWVRDHVLDIVNLSQKVVGHLVGSLFTLFFVLMIAAFVLLDTDAILAFFRGLVPAHRREGYDALLRRIDQKLSGVVRGQIMICLVNGVLTLIGLLIFDVNFAFILAIIATVLTFIPIFGTIISTIPIVLVGLSQSFSTALAALLWILAIHALEAYFLNPKILGSSAKIHPAMIAFAILAGERTYGFAGALFAVPVLSIGLSAFTHFKERAHLLAERRTEEEVGEFQGESEVELGS